ncbi:MAG TPA: enoyl-CoA hydratase/isomerase family protein [Longimicrobiales bacterium]|nr:enoyl-CoA hydratase/isomerase family protein [Longimicrobiales bacterium]
MAYDNISVSRNDHAATLRLEGSPGNLLNIDIMEELNQALLELRGTDGIEVLILRGSGNNFCEGLDLADHRKERLQRLLQVYSRIFETIRMMDMVTIAAVKGKAWGSGFELALGCNLIVAAETASFRLPEIEKGIIPHIASIILPRVAPRRMAMEWILTGKEIGTQDLHRVGLVNRIFSDDAFDAGVDELVGELTGKSGPVLQLARRAQAEAYYSTYEEALYRVQNLYLRELMELEDASEGVTAHLEGRAPVWKNR